MDYASWKEKYLNAEKNDTQARRRQEIRQALNRDGVVKINIAKIGDANIPTAKMTKYALNPEKDANKARAFERALGYNLGNLDKLIENIENHINDYEIIKKAKTQYGEPFQITLQLKGENGKTAFVTTAWIIDYEKGEIRMTSIYIDKAKNGNKGI